MPESDLRVLIEAARAAGDVARRFDGPSAKLWHKPDDAGPVTEADLAVNELLHQRLTQARPDYGWLSEETEDGAARLQTQRVFVIDPIDGTVNYFYSIPHFAVSIALRRNGKIVVGVIYDPMRDEMWSVREGQPALLNGQPIAVSTRTQLSESIVSVGVSKSLNSINRGLPLFEKMVRGAKKCRMMGSASLDIAYVSCGRLDAYIESMISLWDVAAGILLVESAGGRVDLTPHESAADKYGIVATSGLIPIE